MSRKLDSITTEDFAEVFYLGRSGDDIAERIHTQFGINVSRTTVYRYAKALGLTKTKNTKDHPIQDADVLVDGEVQAPDATRGRLMRKRYVFTCAQNNTKVHEGFLRSIVNFCDDRDAELIVGKITYNKSGFQNGYKDSGKLTWAPELEPYYCNKSMVVAHGSQSVSDDDLIWCGELNILPTAVHPLSGLENYCRSASGIVPHTKVRMNSVPTLKNAKPKFMYTTGAITRRNYIEQKTGQKAAFHHVFGALYVEVDDDGTWFARQLVADNRGCFYDLTDYYYPEGVSRGHSVEAINWGDLHAEMLDLDVAKGAMGIDLASRREWKYSAASMIEVLRPKFQFIHDVSDFRARNHHNIKDPHIRMWQHFGPHDNVLSGFMQINTVLDLMQRPWCKSIVVESNHDVALDKWLREADYRNDPENAEFFLECQLEMYKRLRRGDAPGSFSLMAWVLNNIAPLHNTRFLLTDESFCICNDEERGIECGMHGHIGPNGSWGSPAKFTRIGVKCNTGHTHSAGIVDGVYTAGVTCKLDMGYNKGPSSWSHSHIITYPNGKRAIVTMNGWRWQAGMEVSNVN